jgi:deoxyribodipyrimidine photolyase-like uncharacterized protein
MKYFNIDLPNEITDSIIIKNKEIEISINKYRISKKSLINSKKYNFTHSYDLKYSIFPLNQNDSDMYVENFLKYKIKNYEKYYLLINKNTIVNYHSGFSCLTNIGLIYPSNIKTNNKVFLRQLYIREYYNYIYLFYYNEIITQNYWNLNLKWNKILKSKVISSEHGRDL